MQLALQNTLMQIFLTEDTIECYPHPALAETGYDNFSWQNLKTVIADDFKTDNRIYFSKNAGDPIDHLVAARYWFVHLHGTNQKELKHALILDEKCFAEYAEKLLPRAVGYSAALLDYFFRGEMQVSLAVPVIQDESVQAFVLGVKNVTPTEETMSDGNFAISVGYTPYGRKFRRQRRHVRPLVRTSQAAYCSTARRRP